jgi:excisionase family DNA binding protein
MAPLMTYQEAADYLRISLATIDRMVRAGEISSVLIRGRRLFRIPDLDEYIRAHSVPGGKKVRTWIKHCIRRWHRAEIAYIRRTTQGNSKRVRWLDFLTLAAADHCDGELWIASGRPNSAETLSAICGREAIWMREALEPNARC